MNGEYRGQEVIATVETRLLPPDHNYPDCECMLVLTRQHLYVLEDNFDGTYDTHFEFVLREVDDIVIQKKRQLFMRMAAQAVYLQRCSLR